MPGYIETYRSVLGKYANFTGVASRGEFWRFLGVNVAIVLFLSFLQIVLPRSLFRYAFGWVFVLFVLGTIIPYFALMARRLHDTGRSAVWIAILLAPFGGLMLLAMLARAPAAAPNRYDPFTVRIDVF